MIQNIFDTVNQLIAREPKLQNLQLTCIVKGVKIYPYASFVSVCSKGDERKELTLYIRPSIFDCSTLSVDDIIQVKGNITCKKDIQMSVMAMRVRGKEKSLKDTVYDKLKADGYIDMPKKSIPDYVQNVAIFSSMNSSGLKDCLGILRGAKLQSITIYDVALQGDTMEKSFVEAFNSCIKDGNADVLLIVRGGGAHADLEPFNNYTICTWIKRINIPVITGIGHETDATTTDMVADMSFDTPSIVGEYVKKLASRVVYLNNDIITKHTTCVNKIKEHYSEITESINTMHKNMYTSMDRTLILGYSGKVKELTEKLGTINLAIEKYKNEETGIVTSLMSMGNTVMKYINNLTQIKLFDETNETYITSIKDININNVFLLHFYDGDVKITINME
jgi:exodeoxyribonuclease VII large subunit